jgi:hypothetical protein
MIRPSIVESWIYIIVYIMAGFYKSWSWCSRDAGALTVMIKDTLGAQPAGCVQPRWIWGLYRYSFVACVYTGLEI